MDKQQLIDKIMESADPYFADLFDDADEAMDLCMNFEHNLHQLNTKQVKAIHDYVEETGMNVNVGHDMAGIVRKDRHFLPRIAALKEVTPYLS